MLKNDDWQAAPSHHEPAMLKRRDSHPACPSPRLRRPRVTARKCGSRPGSDDRETLRRRSRTPRERDRAARLSLGPAALHVPPCVRNSNNEKGVRLMKSESELRKTYPAMERVVHVARGGVRLLRPYAIDRAVAEHVDGLDAGNEAIHRLLKNQVERAKMVNDIRNETIAARQRAGGVGPYPLQAVLA